MTCCAMHIRLDTFRNGTLRRAFSDTLKSAGAYPESDHVSISDSIVSPVKYTYSLVNRRYTISIDSLLQQALAR